MTRRRLATPHAPAALRRVVHSLPPLLLLGLALAQQPDTSDLEQLARRVDAAHRTAGPNKPIESFAADLAIQDLASDSKQRGEIELSVKFLDDGVRPLIRYKLIDSARATEQGRDREDYWAVLDGKVQDIRSKDMESDLAACRRNLRLARQMLRFLDPGAVLRGLANPTAVTAEDLKVGRMPAVPCRTVAGDLRAFPLRQQAGDDAPVRVKVFVGKDGENDGRLLALEATPLDATNKPETGKGEFLLFADHRPQKGLLVPMQVTHFAVPAASVRKSQMEVRITTLQLGVELKPADFDRPKR